MKKLSEVPINKGVDSLSVPKINNSFQNSKKYFDLLILQLASTTISRLLKSVTKLHRTIHWEQCTESSSIHMQSSKTTYGPLLKAHLIKHKALVH